MPEINLASRIDEELIEYRIEITNFVNVWRRRIVIYKRRKILKL